MTALWLFALAGALMVGYWLGGRARDDAWIAHAGAHEKLERRGRRYHVVADHDYLGGQLAVVRIQHELAVRERSAEVWLRGDAAEQRSQRARSQLRLIKNRERGPYKPPDRT